MFLFLYFSQPIGICGFKGYTLYYLDDFIQLDYVNTWKVKVLQYIVVAVFCHYKLCIRGYSTIHKLIVVWVGND